MFCSSFRGFVEKSTLHYTYGFLTFVRNDTLMTEVFTYLGWEEFIDSKFIYSWRLRKSPKSGHFSQKLYPFWYLQFGFHLYLVKNFPKSFVKIRFFWVWHSYLVHLYHSQFSLQLPPILIIFSLKGQFLITGLCNFILWVRIHYSDNAVLLVIHFCIRSVFCFPYAWNSWNLKQIKDKKYRRKSN